MSGCDTCQHAEWKRTSNGRLHPDKTGQCKFIWAPPPLPLAFSFSYSSRGELPKPHGGYIQRGDRSYDNCLCYAELVSR